MTDDGALQRAADRQAAMDATKRPGTRYVGGPFKFATFASTIRGTFVATDQGLFRIDETEDGKDHYLTPITLAEPPDADPT